MITEEEYNILIGDLPEYINKDGNRDLDYRTLIPLFENDDVFKSKIKEIIEFSNIKDRHRALLKLAIIVNFESHSILCDESPNFRPTKYQVKLSSFMYSTDTFSSRNIPREKWIDLLEEDLDLLAKMIKEDSLMDFETDERFKQAVLKKTKRRDELAKDYPELYGYR